MKVALCYFTKKNFNYKFIEACLTVI